MGTRSHARANWPRKLLGVDAPFFGVLMTHSTYPNGATLRGSDFLVHCAEAEFGFEMAGMCPRGRPTRLKPIKDFIAFAMPVHRDRRSPLRKLAGRRRTVAARGQRDPWRLGHRRTLCEMARPRLRDAPHRPHRERDEDVPRLGAAVLGNPLNVVAWLANELPKFGRSPFPRRSDHDRLDDRRVPGESRRPPGRGLRGDGKGGGEFRLGPGTAAELAPRSRRWTRSIRDPVADDAVQRLERVLQPIFLPSS